MFNMAIINDNNNFAPSKLAQKSFASPGKKWYTSKTEDTKYNSVYLAICVGV